MANHKNTVAVLYSAAWDTCPLSTAGTGTITMNVATTLIKGHGTLATSELKAGSWIWDGAYEVRKVTQITDNETFTVDYAFSLNQTIALKYIDPPKLAEISVYCQTAGVIVDDILNVMVVNEVLRWEQITANQDSNCAPIIVNATTGKALVNYKTGN